MTKYIFIVLFNMAFGFVALQAHAKAEFSYSASARVRFESKTNKDFNDVTGDYQSFIGSRMRFNFELKDMNKYMILFQPQFSKNFGERDTDGNVTSGALNDPNIYAHQANLSYYLTDQTNLIIGRQEFNYGDQLLIGSVGWSNIGRSFDAVKLGYRVFETLNIDIFFSSLDETNSSGASAGDKNLSGIYTSSSLHELYLKYFDLYYLSLSDSTTSVQKDINIYGLRIKSDTGSLDYRIEWTLEDIEDSSLLKDGSASQYDIEIGYDLPLPVKTKVSAEYFEASEIFNQLLPTGHKWLGFADMFSRKNIRGYNLKFSSDFDTQWAYSLVFHQFFRTNISTSAYNFTGGNYGSIGSNSEIAQEYDLTLSYKKNESLSYILGGSLVTPQNYLKQNGYVNNMEFLYLQIQMSL